MDAEQFKQTQQNVWDKMAKGWLKWWDKFETEASDISHEMIKHAGIDEGDLVLDLATGIGEPALTIARNLGTGRVIGTDLSETMVTLASQRAREENLTNVEFIHSDSTHLPGEPKQFDAVVCRLGLMLIPDIDPTCKMAFDALKPGGKLVGAVFPTPDRAPIVGHTISTLKRILHELPPRKNVPGIFALADPTPLVDSLYRAGFSKVDVTSNHHDFRFDSGEEFTQFTRDVTPPINLQIPNLDDGLIGEFWEMFTRSAEDQYKEETGGLNLNSEILYIIAEK